MYADPGQTDGASSTTRPGHVPLFERLWMQVVVVMVCAVFLSALRQWHFGPATLDHDEATIGIMALRNLRGQAFFFFPAQPYNGGAVVEAGLLAPVVAVLGPTHLAFVVVLGGILAAALLAAIVVSVRLLAGPAQALWPALLVTVASTQTAYYLLKLRGGYALSVLLGVLILCQTVLWRRTGRSRHAVAAGLLWGGAVWVHYFALLLAPAILTVLLVGRAFPRRRWAPLVASVLVGLLPLAIYNPVRSPLAAAHRESARACDPASSR